MQLMRKAPRGAACGFSLVELMVALVAGLVVVGAVLALVVSIMKSNRETLQATRLNQELRATLAVIANDLRRARSVDDPFTEAMAINGNRFGKIRVVPIGGSAINRCAIYGYAQEASGAEWHVVTLESGKVKLRTAQFASGEPAGCSDGDDHDPLGSAQVEVTELSFSPVTTTGTPQATDESLVRELTITITGHLVDSDTGLAGISRTVSQTVYVRSVGVGI